MKEKGRVFGLTIGTQLACYDPDSQLWKTSALSLFGDSMPYSGAFPKSGIALNGKIFVQRTWARRIAGNESGLWPTPQSRDWKGKSQRGADPENRDCLPNAVTNYPTPRIRGLCGGSGHKQMLIAKFGKDEGKEMFNGGQLNPQFVEWLMNYPMNWTDTRADFQISLSTGRTNSAALETASYQ